MSVTVGARVVRVGQPECRGTVLLGFDSGSAEIAWDGDFGKYGSRTEHRENFAVLPVTALADVVTLAHAYQAAAVPYHNAITAYMQERPLLTSATFWASIEPLTISVENSDFDLDRACHTFAGNTLFDAPDRKAQWEQLASFARTYHHMSARLYDVIMCDGGMQAWAHDLDGVDGLCDILPLLGKTICDGILSGGIDSSASLHARITASHGDRWRDFVMDEASNVVSTLDDAVVSQFFNAHGSHR